MDELPIKDGDLVVVAGYTTGTVLERLLEDGTNVDVVVVTPTFQREYDGVSVAEFARSADNADITVFMPIDDTLEVLHEGLVDLLLTRSPDQPRVLEGLMREADRVIGVFETSEPRDGRITPGACSICVPVVIEHADVVVAEENANAPHLLGISFPKTEVDYRVNATSELPRRRKPNVTATHRAIGDNVAEVIPNGATLQLGVGEIPAAVAQSLIGRTGFGLHTGLISTVVRDLVDDGVITRGSAVAEPVENCPFDSPALANTLLGADAAFYKWAEKSNAVALGDMYRTSDAAIVSENDRFTAINSGIQVDLQGQVNAERLQGRQLSTPGGQPSYFRAGRRSDGGVAILALTSTVPDGPSKIVDTLDESGVVTSPRVEIDYVVTENDAAALHGHTLKRRTENLVGAAAPEHRQRLRERAHALEFL